MPKPQYSGPWRRIRKTILQRDLHTCQIQGPNCTQHATQVDHITPVAHGGAWYDPNNLRAACPNCNNQRPANQRNEQWRNTPTHITLIYGPPSAGKTTYVNKHRKPGEMVIDYDTIAQALGSPDTHGHDTIHESVNAARNAVLRTVRQGKVKTPRVWIISSNPNAPTIFPYHDTVLIDPGLEQTLAQAKAAGRPHQWLQLIRNWYQEEHTKTATNQTPNSRRW